MKKYNTDIFIKKAKQIHCDKYDYSKVNYINNKIKVCIICPEHGEFWQMPNHHLKGCDCPKCVKERKRYTKEEFIEKAKQIHVDRYDYSKINYIDMQTKVCIICPKHGEFWQLPNNHLQSRGCPICGKITRYNKIQKTKEEFIRRAKEIYGDKYDYSKVKYEGCDKKVCIICPEHGEFWQTPNCHLNNHSCPKCGGNYPLNNNIFIERARKIHGNKYDYSKVDYVNTYTKVCIICPKHGEFWQNASQHLQGRGCPHCKQSSLEKEIMDFLNQEKINYIAQKRFSWLKRQSLDFYLPDYDIAIECQGKQHFEPSEYFGGLQRYNKTIILDKNKNKLCKQHNIKILYYTHYEINYEYKLITCLDDLKKEIYNN